MGLFDYFSTLGRKTATSVIPTPTTSTGQQYLTSPQAAPPPSRPAPAPTTAQATETLTGGPPRPPEWWSRYQGLEELITRTPTGYDTRAADVVLFERGYQAQTAASPRLQALSVANRALVERQSAVTAHAQAIRSGDWGLIEAARVQYLKAEAAHNTAMAAFGGEKFLMTPTRQMQEYGITMGPAPKYVGAPRGAQEFSSTMTARMAQTMSVEPTTRFSPLGWLDSANRKVSGMITSRAPWLLPGIERYGTPVYRIATAPSFFPIDLGAMAANRISGAKNALPSQLYAEAFKGYVSYPIEKPVSAAAMVGVGAAIGAVVRGATVAAATPRGAAFLAAHPTAAAWSPRLFTYGLGGIAAVGAASQITGTGIKFNGYKPTGIILKSIPSGTKTETITKQISPTETEITTISTPQYRYPTQLEMAQRTGQVAGEFTFGLLGAYGGYHIPEGIKAFRAVGETGMLLPPKEIKPIRTIDLTKELDVPKTTARTLPSSPIEAQAQMEASRLHMRIRSTRTGGFKPYFYEMQEINANIRAGMAMFPETAVVQPATKAIVTPTMVRPVTTTKPWRVMSIPVVTPKVEAITISTRKLAYPFVAVQKGYPFQEPKTISQVGITQTEQRRFMPVSITRLNRITSQIPQSITRVTQERKSFTIPKLARITEPRITQERKSVVIPKITPIQIPRTTQEIITTTVPDVVRIPQRVTTPIVPTMPSFKIFMPGFPPFPAMPRGGGGGRGGKGRRKKSWTLTNPVPTLKGFTFNTPKIKLPKW